MSFLDPFKAVFFQHKRLARTIFSRSAAKAQASNAGSKTTISVSFLEGVQAGITSDYAKTKLKVGADASNDVVLLGIEESDYAFSLDAVRTAFGQGVSIEFVDPDASILGEDPPDPNDGPLVVPLPVKIATRSTVLEIKVQTERSGTPGLSAAKRGFSSLSHVGQVGIAGLIVVILLFFYSIFSPDTRYQLQNSVDLADANAGLSQEQLMLRAMNKEIRVAQLGDVTASMADEGVVFSGNVSEPRAVAWARLKAEWNSRFPEAQQSDRTRIVSALDVLPPVAFVRLGENGYVQLLTKQKIEIGEEIADGWKLIGVEDTRLLVQRRDMLLAVNYRSLDG